MARRQRIEQLMERFAESSAKKGSASRRAPVRRSAPVRLPVISHGDAGGIARALHREMDKVGELRDRFADERELDVACRRGCGDCCNTVVVTYEPEAIAIAQWLSRPKNREVREHFLARFPAWNEAIGDEVEALERLHVAGEVEQAEALHHEMQHKMVMCAFNRDGECAIYPVRPNTCRFVLALDTNEFCHPRNPAGHGPTLMGFEPADRFMARALSIVRVAHRQIRDLDAPPTAVCKSVHRLLQDPEALTGDASGTGESDAGSKKPGRNQPCPCGSGKKYKRCCGA